MSKSFLGVRNGTSVSVPSVFILNKPCLHSGELFPFLILGAQSTMGKPAIQATACFQQLIIMQARSCFPICVTSAWHAEGSAGHNTTGAGQFGQCGLPALFSPVLGTQLSIAKTKKHWAMQERLTRIHHNLILESSSQMGFHLEKPVGRETEVAGSWAGNSFWCIYPNMLFLWLSWLSWLSVERSFPIEKRGTWVHLCVEFSLFKYVSGLLWFSL